MHSVSLFQVILLKATNVWSDVLKQRWYQPLVRRAPGKKYNEYCRFKLR